jgi:hypothetical protein
MTSSVYDELGPTGEFVTFPNEGDSITGTITSIGLHTWDDGKKSLQLGLDVAGESRVLTAGPIGMQIKLQELRPDVGDTLTVTYLGSEKRAGGKTLKKWDVKVAKGAVAADSPPF